MYDAQKTIEELIDKLPYLRQEMLDDAHTMKTYGEAKKYVKEFKHDFGGDYSGTPEEQILSAFNTMIEETVTKLNRESDKGEIRHD